MPPKKNLKKSQDLPPVDSSSESEEEVIEEEEENDEIVEVKPKKSKKVDKVKEVPKVDKEIVYIKKPISDKQREHLKKVHENKKNDWKLLKQTKAQLSKMQLKNDVRNKEEESDEDEEVKYIKKKKKKVVYIEEESDDEEPRVVLKAKRKINRDTIKNKINPQPVYNTQASPQFRLI